MHLSVLSLLVGCGDKESDSATPSDPTPADDTAPDSTTMEGFNTTSCADYPDPCKQIAAGDSDGLQVQANMLEDGLTIVLAEGTYGLDNQVTPSHLNKLHR